MKRLATLSVRAAGEAGARRGSGRRLVRLDGLDDIFGGVPPLVLFGRRGRLVLVGTESLGEHGGAVSAAAEQEGRVPIIT